MTQFHTSIGVGPVGSLYPEKIHLFRSIVDADQVIAARSNDDHQMHGITDPDRERVLIEAVEDAACTILGLRKELSSSDVATLETKRTELAFDSGPKSSKKAADYSSMGLSVWYLGTEKA